MAAENTSSRGTSRTNKLRKSTYNLTCESDLKELTEFIQDENFDIDILSDYGSGSDYMPPQCNKKSRVRQDEGQEDGTVLNFSESSSDSDVEEARPVVEDTRNKEKNKKPKQTIVWMKERIINPDTTFLRQNQNDISPTNIDSPLQYFLRYIGDDLFEEMVQYTNMYALQKEVKSFKPTDRYEMKTLVALHIAIGSLNKFPKLRLYSDATLGIGLFLENMTRDRFFQLRTCLHFVDVLRRPTNNKDRFYKVRALLNSIQKRCSQLELDENLCIDEQMIPFTGNLNIKQYVKGKPYPWGIKNFCLCGESGLAHNFLLYQGKETGLDKENLKKYGLGASIVLYFANNIPPSNHKLFYDNYFSSYAVLKLLTDKNIWAAGTVRLNRFQNPPLTPDKDIKREKGGFTDEVRSTDNISMVKWLDNQTVCMASNFVGKGQEDTVKRWDKKSNKYISIQRPEVIAKYNRSMGGVDILDQMISTYRIFIKSRKLTLRIIMHMVDFALANSWLEYKRDCKLGNIPKNKILDFLPFRFEVTNGLIIAGKPTCNVRKKGRPSSAGDTPPPIKSCKKEREEANCRCSV